MDQPLTKEESYAERRKLFKNIWETSMHVDDKDDIMSKPKIIKTLRLDEMDRCTAEKKKKQRIKNLRAVCNKLLDFCDRQDADDLFYEQMALQGKEPEQHVIEPKIKRKQFKGRKNVRKAKSTLPSIHLTALTRPIISEVGNELKIAAKTSRDTSPIKIKRKSPSLARKKTLKTKQSPKASLKSNFLSEDTNNNPIKKIVKKKQSKRKPLQITTIEPNIYDNSVKI